MKHVAMSVIVGVGLLTAGASAGEKNMIDDQQIKATTAALVDKHGDGVRKDAAVGVSQVAMFWRPEDGAAADFDAFCQQHFVPDAAGRQALLNRFDRNLEAVWGHAVSLARTIKEPLDVTNAGDQLPVDLLFASLNPFDHFADDAFKTRVAFVALLNFPLRTAEELARDGDRMDRAAWAAARLVLPFSMRIPGEARQATTRAYAAVEEYIAHYNIHMNRVTVAKGRRPFKAEPGKELVLISHWNLRDHIKSLYSDPKKNTPDQRLIQKIMYRIIRQEIPAVMVDGKDYDWDPVTNAVTLAELGKAVADPGQREPDRRYRMLLDVFQAERQIDRFSPAYPTLMDRRFNYERELPEARVEALLKAVLDDPIGKQVADVIRKRLGRDLEPFDIWYDGFKVRGSIPEDQLNQTVRTLYPTLEAFGKKLPDILQKLGFSADTARFLSERIRVDPARGAGHAMGAAMRTDAAHLRTRVPEGGMDYKGYNIAMHELGHTVEQTFSLYRVDRVLMNGVPNTAFTEAMAFLFQERDLDLLGLGTHDATRKAMAAVDAFWMTREIAGVSLLDMQVWRWMYANPNATPEQLREAVVRMATDLWNRYYAPVMGSTESPIKDSPILAIYSHMIAYGLYLPDYTIGHLIQAQLERAVDGKNLGTEMERWCVQGRLSPDIWMKNAVGAPLSAEPLLQAAREGVAKL